MPDLFIAEPRRNCSGLFIEFKKQGTKLFKKNGQYVNPHIEEQAEIIKMLLQKNYNATFAIGWDMAKKIIDHYLK